ncbi:hypothetical protein F2Q70_00001666 [Brassica cretica]|uniref:Uncharacterized protein n=1 Tax=Brassica cretica TaxID=69181 RepID=A0A8S9ISV8_BRACR|nr:hypothetical protein F2Q70_00001666 [Brassica cretica]
MEEEIIADLELSYLPAELINTSGCPPVIIANDRQLQNFVRFVQKSDSTRLCVTCKANAENPNEAAFDLNKSPADPYTDEEEKTRLTVGTNQLMCMLRGRARRRMKSGKESQLMRMGTMMLIP